MTIALVWLVAYISGWVSSLAYLHYHAIERMQPPLDLVDDSKLLPLTKQASVGPYRAPVKVTGEEMIEALEPKLVRKSSKLFRDECMKCNSTAEYSLSSTTQKWSGGADYWTCPDCKYQNLHSAYNEVT